MSSKNMSRYWTIAVFAVFAVVALCAVLLTIVLLQPSDTPAVAEPDTNRTTPATVPGEPSPDGGKLTITFAGLTAPASLGGGDVYGTFNQYLKDTGAASLITSLSPYQSTADLSVCSLAAVLSDRELTAAYTTERPYLHMKGSASAASFLAEAGFTAASVLNAHCLDYGTEGYGDTLLALRSASLSAAENLSVLPIPGTAVSGVILVISSAGKETNALLASVAEAAARYPFLILYDACDKSLEDSTSLRTLYRLLVDAGADLIVGVHGESVFASELYGTAYIFPAIGEFLNGMAPLEQALLLRVQLTVKDGKVSSVVPEWLPFTQNADWTYRSLAGTAEGDLLLAKIAP